MTRSLFILVACSTFGCGTRSLAVDGSSIDGFSIDRSVHPDLVSPDTRAPPDYRIPDAFVPTPPCACTPPDLCLEPSHTCSPPGTQTGPLCSLPSISTRLDLTSASIPASGDKTWQVTISSIVPGTDLATAKLVAATGEQFVLKAPAAVLLPLPQGMSIALRSCTQDLYTATWQIVEVRQPATGRLLFAGTGPYAFAPFSICQFTDFSLSQDPTVCKPIDGGPSKHIPAPVTVFPKQGSPISIGATGTASLAINNEPYLLEILHSVILADKICVDCGSASVALFLRGKP